MRLSRLDLDGASSPAALVERIFELEPDLPVPVPLEALCRRLDIPEIATLETTGFEAALLTDGVRSQGVILLAKGRPPRRRRFSIAHELGHFLMPWHHLPAGQMLQCSAEQLRLLDTGEKDRRAQMEAEANRFAAHLLMPPGRLQLQLRQLAMPQVTDIARLARVFDVSKEAMVRSYVEHSDEAVAFVSVCDGRIQRLYRNDERFPWIAVNIGAHVPEQSAFRNITLRPGESSEPRACDPRTWLDDRAARRVGQMIEQVLVQNEGYSLLMLHARAAR